MNVSGPAVATVHQPFTVDVTLDDPEGLAGAKEIGVWASPGEWDRNRAIQASVGSLNEVDKDPTTVRYVQQVVIDQAGSWSLRGGLSSPGGHRWSNVIHVEVGVGEGLAGNDPAPGLAP